MTSARREFQVAYAAGLRAYVAEGGEVSLRAGYELGREAVVRELSLLDLSAVHHETLLGPLRRAADEDELEGITRAAADFFVETLSAFEMVQRGVREARDAAMAERRRSTMLRQLSSLLADPSLAFDASDSIVEALRLVAEEARELTAAGWCVVTAALGGRPGQVSEAAVTDGAGDASALMRPADLVRRCALVEGAGSAVQLSGAELARSPAFAGLREAEGAPALSGWMGVPLTSLDGRDFGSLEVFDSEQGSFTELDEAILVHVAQMASAALERAQLHRRR